MPVMAVKIHGDGLIYIRELTVQLRIRIPNRFSIIEISIKKRGHTDVVAQKVAEGARSVAGV